MKRFITCGLVAALLAAAVASAVRAADPVPVSGTIDAVTVYQGQALVTRIVDIPGPAGVKDILVGGLPERVQPGSIFAEGENGVSVRSVSYSVRPVDKDVREEVQKLDTQIRDLQDKISANQRKGQVLQSQKDYLTKLETFTATTANVELTKGVLNADTLMKLTEYQFTQRQAISDKERDLALELRGFNEQLQTAQRNRAQIATTSSKLEREARVSVELTGNGGKMRVRYIVDNATWLPSYNVRATKKQKDKITVEYLASIQQLSGEDWSNVTMTLSTATPSMVAKAPLLSELAITSGRPGQPNDILAQLQQGGNEKAREDLLNQRNNIEQFRGQLGTNVAGNFANGNFNMNPGVPNSGPISQQAQPQAPANTFNLNGTVVNLDYIGDDNDVDRILNKTAGDLQLVDLLAKERIARSKEKPTAMSQDGGVAVTYTLGNSRTTLQSRSDRQLIRIAALDFGASVYKVAIPVLTTAVYDEATVTNDKMVLLWGDVNTYMDNEFVGRGVMPSVAIGQRFSVGLGNDSSLRARRELVEKSEAPQGGNRVVDFTYRLIVENFGSAPAPVRIIDRLPKANEADIKVTPPVAPKGAKEPWLSDDPAYTESDAKKGILRWDREIPARAVDDKAYTLDYSFKLEYAANAVISTPTPPPSAANTGGGGMGGGGGGRGGMGSSGAGRGR
jgi:hypothetical protein